MAEEHVVLQVSGEQAIGILHRAKEAATTGVVVVVGGPQFRVGSHRQFLLLSREIASAGFHVFRFDVRGMGDSDGEPRGFDALDVDIRCAVDALYRACPTLRRVALVGLCDGASAALMYAPGDARVAALALLNPWARSEAGAAKVRLRRYYLERLVSREFWQKLLGGGVRVRASVAELAGAARSAAAGAPSADFLERMERAAAAYHGEVLILLSDQDYTAEEFRQWVAASELRAASFDRRSITMHTIPGSNHTFSTAQSHASMSREIVRLLSTLSVAT